MTDLFELTSQYGSEIDEWPTHALTAAIDMLELELEERADIAAQLEDDDEPPQHTH